MKQLKGAIVKTIMCLFLITIVLLSAAPEAQAFNLTITNNYDKEHSFAILYYDDVAKQWSCKGWYNVPANTEKDYNFSNSTSLKYAYIYSSVWNGDYEEGAIKRTIIDNKFQFYDGQQCPDGKNRRTVAFSKFGMCINGAQLIWGEASTVKSQTTTNTTNTNTAGITADELKAIELLNEDRVAQGLPRLIADANLTQVARKHATDMVLHNFFDHKNLQGQSPFDRMTASGITYRSAGENIAYNYSLEDMEKAWMNSPGHRANILNTGYTHVGLGLHTKSDGTIYGVQLFASY